MRGIVHQAGTYFQIVWKKHVARIEDRQVAVHCISQQVVRVEHQTGFQVSFFEAINGYVITFDVSDQFFISSIR